MPFRDLSPLDAVNKSTKTSNRQLTFEKYSGRLHFRTRTGSDDESESDYKLDASKDDDDKEENEGLILTIPPAFKSYVLKYRNTFWTNLINLI